MGKLHNFFAAAVAFVFALGGNRLGKLGTLTYWWALRLSRACLMHAAKCGGHRRVKEGHHVCHTHPTNTHTLSHTSHKRNSSIFMRFRFFASSHRFLCVCVFDESEKCPRNGEKVGKLWLPVLSLMLCKMKVNRVRLFECVCVCVLVCASVR